MTLDNRLNWEEHIDRVRAKEKKIALYIMELVAEKSEEETRNPKKTEKCYI